MQSSILTISAVARAFGVTIATVRNWDRSGRLKPKMRMPTGYRVYTREQVMRFQEEAEERAKCK